MNWANCIYVAVLARFGVHGQDAELFARIAGGAEHGLELPSVF